MIRINRNNFGLLSRTHSNGLHPWVNARLTALEIITGLMLGIVSPGASPSASELMKKRSCSPHLLYSWFRIMSVGLPVLAGNKLKYSDVQSVIDDVLNKKRGISPGLTDQVEGVRAACQYAIAKLDQILVDRPINLVQHESLIRAHYAALNDDQRGWIESRLAEVFDYDGWSSQKRSGWRPIDLAIMLKIAVCPYCNRQYTSVLRGGSGNPEMRPAFDHFMPKAKHPLLALSFWNLIPCCTSCNSTFKQQLDFQPTTHLHPYLEGFGDDLRFTMRLTGHTSDLEAIEANCEIDFKPGSGANHSIVSKGERHLKAFRILDVYQSHRDAAAEIWFKTKAYSDGYLDGLFGLHAPVTKADAARLVLGNYVDEREWEKRPLAKMTRDIAKELDWPC